MATFVFNEGTYVYPDDPGETGANGLPAYAWLSPFARTVRASVPVPDGCQVLTRVKAFVTPQGVPCLLGHTLRDRDGAVVDLAGLMPEVLASASAGSPDGTAVLLVRPWVGGTTTCDGVAVPAVSSDPSGGQLLAPLPPAVVDRAGLYDLCWVVSDGDGRVAVTGTSLLSVERAIGPKAGPLTIGEIRTFLVDTGYGDNLLLNDVEFSDDQLVQAIALPVQQWNESLPRLRTANYTAANFPFRREWLLAAVGHLDLMAAAHYRRNRLAIQTSGLVDDSKNRANEYQAEGQRLLAEYKEFVRAERYRISMARAWGSIGSDYSTSPRRRW